MTATNPRKRRTILKAVGAAGIGGLAGCIGDDDDDDVDPADDDDDVDPADDDDEEPAEEVELVLGTAPDGSSTHAAATALTRAVSDHSDTLTLRLQQSDGWVSNTYLYDGGEFPSCGIDNNTVAHAVNQWDPFDDNPVASLPAQGIHFTALHIYLMGVEGSGLESSGEIGEEHTIYPIQPGFGTRLLTEEVYERAGLDVAEYINVDVGDIPGAIEEGRVDALAVYGSDFVDLAGWVAEVDVRNDVYALEADDDLVQAVEDTPGARFEQFEPYGWEQDVTQFTDEVISWTLDGQWFFGPDADPDAVYEFARITHEYPETIQEADPTYPDHSDPEAMAVAFMDDYPVHPALAEFYEDVGVDIGDLPVDDQLEI